MPTVESTNIAKVEWIAGHLYVLFHSGDTYKYLHVPRMTYLNLLDAKSKGEFLNKIIKPKYGFQKVDGIPMTEEMIKRQNLLKSFDEITISLEKRGLVRREMDEHGNQRVIYNFMLCPKCGGDCSSILEAMKRELQQ